MLHIESTGPGDLIRELSPETVQYFATMELAPDEWSGLDSPLYGKFVRFGEVIVVAPDIDFSVQNMRIAMRHEILLRHTFQGMGEDIVEKIHTTTVEGKYLGGVEGFVDAGHTKIMASNGTPYLFVMNDKSLSFGRGDEAARELTREIAASILAPTVTVITQSF